MTILSAGRIILTFIVKAISPFLADWNAQDLNQEFLNQQYNEYRSPISDNCALLFLPKLGR
jgi:hypothetical protein